MKGGVVTMVLTGGACSLHFAAKRLRDSLRLRKRLFEYVCLLYMLGC